MCPFCLAALALGGASVAGAGGIGLWLGCRRAATRRNTDEA
ncbi:MAG TPA: hypothetical protein VLC30_13665 [Pseudomonas sp.]|nr:hypothetical protein [Pseudomonas sp.]